MTEQELTTRLTREVYFVVAVNLDDQTITIDDNEFTARFAPHEQVWDYDLEQWRDYAEGEYERALLILNTKHIERNGN